MVAVWTKLMTADCLYDPVAAPAFRLDGSDMDSTHAARATVLPLLTSSRNADTYPAGRVGRPPI